MSKQDKERKGVGRPPSPYPETTMKVRFKDEAERKAYMSISPRKRVELALRARHILLNMPTCAGVWLYYSGSEPLPIAVHVFGGTDFYIEDNRETFYCYELPGKWWGPVPEVPKEMAEANALTIGERL